MGKRKAEGESKPKSSKKEKTDDDEDGAPPKTYQERLKALSPISSPLADEKLTQKTAQAREEGQSRQSFETGREGSGEIIKARDEGHVYSRGRRVARRRHRPSAHSVRGAGRALHLRALEAGPGVRGSHQTADVGRAGRAEGRRGLRAPGPPRQGDLGGREQVR